jgi:hypothetical protein
MMGAQGVQKIMGYSKSNLVTEVTAAEAKARQIAAAAVTYPKRPVAAEVGRFLSFGRGLPAPYHVRDVPAASSREANER